MDLFFNTIHISGQELKEATHRVGTQNLVVLRFFQRYSVAEFSPRDVYAGLRNLGIISKEVELTSIRRAITTLTKEGMLVKTARKVNGGKGAKNYTWTLKK